MAFDKDIRVSEILGITRDDFPEKLVGDGAPPLVFCDVEVMSNELEFTVPVVTPQAMTPLDEYLSLVRAFPLISIRDDAHLKKALAEIDVMLDLPNRSEAQETYLGALTDLVETYETVHVVFPPRTGLDALRFLIESNNLRQEDLVPVFGTKSIVSEVLNERRERKLTLDHVKRLATYFHVSPAVFIDDVSG